jgi:predicted alpha-1,2-mannosidase
MGGGKKFVDKLQMVFDQNLYDPANEPDIAYPYLFNYFKGDEWRTQKETHRILEKYYKDAPDGIPGNDDCGTMSAWALFTMMGLYPDCPGSPYYALTAPVFDKITLHLDKKYYPNGDITIEAKHSSPNDIYIKGISLGGKKWNGYRISHQELVRGCHLKYILGEEK